jgi:hypothetical protein
MLVIKRLRDTDDGHYYEAIATYENGEFHHNQDLADGLAVLEGRPEEAIQRSLDGPHTIAVRPDRDQ